MNVMLAIGEGVDPFAYGTIASVLIRCAGKLGLTRRARDVSNMLKRKQQPWSPLRDALRREKTIDAEVSEAAE